MRRRRSSRWSHGDSFGASLADILTTALGCVLLLFLVAVLSARLALQREMAAHTETLSRLIAEAEGRQVAEVERQVVQGQKSAVESALESEQAARGQLERALAASEETRRSLQSELAGAVARAESLSSQLGQQEEALAHLRTTLGSVQGRLSRLREIAGAAAEPAGNEALPPVDLLLVIDGTGSMGPSIDAARGALDALVTALGVVSGAPRVGVVVFRDHREGEDLRIEAMPPTADLAALSRFLAGVRATSTRVDTDLPEWMSGGMAEAARMSLRPDAIRLMVVVSDASDQAAHGVPGAEAVAAKFRADGGRVYVVSTVPAGAARSEDIAADYRDAVLPEHARIARAGGGVHIPEAGAEALMREVLQAVLATRDTSRLDALRDALQADDALGDAPSPRATGAEDAPPEPTSRGVDAPAEPSEPTRRRPGGLPFFPRPGAPR